MALLDIAVVRRHLRIMHEDEDEEIAVYQVAAESIVISYLDREVVAVDVSLPIEGEVDHDPCTIHVTPAITAAILLLVGDLYENREADAESKGDAVLPRAVRSLLAPWRIWRTMEES